MAFAQKKSEPIDSSKFHIEFTELEKMTFQDNDEFEKQAKIQVDLFNQAIAIRREEHQKFVSRIYQSRKIPIQRLSDKGDSLIVTKEGIDGILKPKKK